MSAVEGIAQQAIEWRLSPSDPWRPAGLSARTDYDHQTLAKYQLISGSWPHKKVFGIGQGGDTAFDIHAGDRIYIRVNSRETTIAIGSVIYDQIVQPPSFGGSAQFYTTLEEFGHLTGSENYNRIFASTAQFDPDRATAIANTMQDKLEKQNLLVGGASPRGGSIADPYKHFFQDPLDGLFFIMGFMATITLILGLFLVYNTITALINRQINQIGILKAIGARTRIIFFVYLTIVFIYGRWPLCSRFHSVPWRHASGRLPAGRLQRRGRLRAVAARHPGPGGDRPGRPHPGQPCARSGPASRITVREAISNYGLRAEATLLDRLLARLRFMPEMLALPSAIPSATNSA